MVNLCLTGYQSIFCVVDSFASRGDRAWFKLLVGKVVRATWRMDLDNGLDASIG